MKVGTDGVLLGAWSRVETCNHILDVGTGSGLIALMVAQRNQAAIIDAIDIDPVASEQAAENAQASPFKGRISVHPLSLADFAVVASKEYDHIISNPPFSRLPLNVRISNAQQPGMQILSLCLIY